MSRFESSGRRQMFTRAQQAFRGTSSTRGRKRFSLRALYWRVRAFSGLIVLAACAVPAFMVVSSDHGATVSAPAPSGSYYASCADARAAGVAPIFSSQSGYRSALDADHDGVACEAFGW